MAIPAANQPIDAVLRFPIDMRKWVKDIAYEGIKHAAVAKVFALHSFVGGFCFGASMWLADRSIEAIYTIANIDPEERVANLVTKTFKLFISPFMAALLTTAIGFPISFPTAIILNGSASGIAVATGVCCVLTVIAVVATKAGIGILRRMHNDRCDARQAVERILNDPREDNRDGAILRAMGQIREIFNEAFHPHEPLPGQECH